MGKACPPLVYSAHRSHRLSRNEALPSINCLPCNPPRPLVSQVLQSFKEERRNQMVPVSIPADVASPLLGVLATPPGQAGSAIFSEDNESAFSTFSDSLLSELGSSSPTSLVPGGTKPDPTSPKKDDKDLPALAATALPIFCLPAIAPVLAANISIPGDSSSQVAVQPFRPAGQDHAIASAPAAAQTARSDPSGGVSGPSAKISDSQSAFDRATASLSLTEADPGSVPVQQSSLAGSAELSNDNSGTDTSKADNSISIANTPAISQPDIKQGMSSAQTLTSVVPGITSNWPSIPTIDPRPAPAQVTRPEIPNKGTAGQTNSGLAETKANPPKPPASGTVEQNSVALGTDRVGADQVDRGAPKPTTTAAAEPEKANLGLRLAEAFIPHAPSLLPAASDKAVSAVKENTADRDRISSAPPATKPDTFPKASPAVQAISGAKPAETKSERAKADNAKPAADSVTATGAAADADTAPVTPCSLPSSTTALLTGADAAPTPAQAHAGLEDAHSVAESKIASPPSTDPPVAPTPTTGSVQTAHLVDQMGQTEMHIGLRTSAFGNVEVHTIVRDAQVGVAMGSERGDLKSFLASEVPALQSAFRQQNLRLETIQFTGQGGSLNAGFSGGAEQQSRSFRSQPSSHGSGARDQTSPEAAGAESPIRSWPGLNVHA